MKIRIEVVTDDGTFFQGDAVLARVAKARTPTTPVKPVKTKVKCPEAIKRLWQAGQFKSPLSFADIKTGLSQEGYNFPNNTLMMALTNANYLTKRGGKGSYQWLQRHPYNG
ncbi:MAG: hypothetical protein ABSH11_12270 [Verrucomicrobiota bacterium]